MSIHLQNEINELKARVAALEDQFTVLAQRVSEQEPRPVPTQNRGENGEAHRR